MRKLSFLDYMNFKLLVKDLINLFDKNLFQIEIYHEKMPINLLNNLKDILVKANGYLDDELELINNVEENYENILYVNQKLDEMTYKNDYIILYTNKNKKIKDIQSSIDCIFFKSFKKYFLELFDDIMKIKELFDSRNNKIIDKLVKCEFKNNICIKNNSTYFKILDGTILKIRKLGNNDYLFETIRLDEYFRVWKSKEYVDEKQFKNKVSRYPMVNTHYFIEDVL